MTPHGSGIRPARHINKKRQKAGNKVLDTGKRDMDQIILLALECIHDQCVEGALAQDIMFRCEINYHYSKQVIEYLLSNQFIQEWQTMDEPDNEEENSQIHTKYFLTQKGSEMHQCLKQELEAIGFVPRLGNKRV